MQAFFDWVISGSGWIQMVSLVTGIVYMALQVFQHMWMWYFGLMTAGTALMVSLFNVDAASGVWAPLWAQVALNGYFFTMDILGIISWKRLRSGMPDGDSQGTEAKGASPREAPLHLVRVTPLMWLRYAAIGIVSTPLVCYLLSLTNDPQPVADGLSMSLSIVAQLMLNRSHLEQWYPWLAADLIVAGIFAVEGDWWMVVLYMLYVISCIAGFVNWRRRGVYVGTR